MKRTHSNQSGFTLLEIIVVLAVLGALAAMLAPVVFRYIEDANETRAQADTNAIATAINKMYKDTGRYPFYASGTGKLAYTSGTDAAILSSNTACNITDDVVALDTTEPEDGGSWNLATSLCDSLTRQLITNAPSYSTSGSRAWLGPYLERVPATDPWGRSYLVNIANADPTDGTKVVWVLSAGPDGTIDTSATTLLTGAPAAADDDVVARVR